MIRVLVVDDVAFMRIAVRRMIDSEPDMKVVGEARNGQEAVAMARSLQPDAVTMDVEMPVMDGLNATSEILASVSPPPTIVMVSATTQRGAADTMEALRRGAADFVSKSTLFAKTDLAHIEFQLRTILRACAAPRPESAVAAPSAAAQPPRPPDLVVVGASTGGPHALARLLGSMGRLEPPLVVALHMPRFFTAGLAEMLSAGNGLDVREAVANAPLDPGAVHIIPGGQHGTVVRGISGFRLQLAPAGGEIAPSVDRLFTSAARAATAPCAVLLTGMGRDGTEGAVALHQRGAPVLVQRPAECVVAGMVELAIAAGAVSAVLPLEGLAAWLSGAAGIGPARPRQHDPAPITLLP